MSSVGAQDSPILTGIPRHQPPSRSTGGLAREFRIPPINLALFVLTALTTTMAGALWNGASLDIDHPLLLVFGLGAGLSYSIPLLAILLFHELGHYVTARRNGVEASLPYFIPAPYPLFLIGTFGAFIRMKSAPRSRRVMFDVGAAGPWAGMLLAVPAVIIGLKLSDVLPLDQSAGGLELGNSLLFLGLARWVLGVDPNSVTVILHPIAFAGWLGLFVTSLNLLPVGQLDGGHVVYALFGRRHRLISRLFVASSVLMVIVPWAMGWGYWLGWLLWAVLLMFLGLGHPAALDAETPLDPRRRLYAWATVVLFIVTFSPVPLSFTAPRAIHNESQSYSVIHHAPAPRPLAHSI